jgi:hypothetical protein
MDELATNVDLAKHGKTQIPQTHWGLSWHCA